jgi:hypothetical protein
LFAGTNTNRSDVSVTGAGVAVGAARGANVSINNTAASALTATGPTTLDATTNVTVSGAQAATGLYTIITPNLALSTGTVRSNTGIVVQSRSTTNQNAGRTLALGDINAAQSARNDLSNATVLNANTINRLSAPVVTLQSGPNAGAGANVTLGNLTLDSAAIPSLVLLPGTGARAEVVGALQRTGATPVNFAIGGFNGALATNWIADTIVITGSIGVTSQAGNAAGTPLIAPFGRVQLVASDLIAMGPINEFGAPLENYLIGLDTNFDLSQLGPPSQQLGHVFVAASELDVSSAGRILLRNTGFTADEGRGLLLGQLEVRGIGALAPTQVSLFGILDRFNMSTAPLTGPWIMAGGRDAAVAGGSTQPTLQGGLTQRSVYRINGCELVSAASCIITVNLEMGVRPPQVVPDLASLKPDDQDILEETAVTNLGNDALIIRGR